MKVENKNFSVLFNVTLTSRESGNGEFSKVEENSIISGNSQCEGARPVIICSTGRKLLTQRPNVTYTGT